jgi:hypothetical protein
VTHITIVRCHHGIRISMVILTVAPCQLVHLVRRYQKHLELLHIVISNRNMIRHKWQTLQSEFDDYWNENVNPIPKFTDTQSQSSFLFLLYCFKSCTSIHFKTLKSHTKTFKFAPTCFVLLCNHLQEVSGLTLLGYWIEMSIYICYNECRYVAVCQFIPSVCVCVCVCVWVCVCVGGYLSGRDYFVYCSCIIGRTAHGGSRGTALLYRHWGSVQAVRPIGGVEV